MPSSNLPPQEIELKLLVRHDAQAVLQAHPVFAAAEAETRRQVTTYFDAADYPLGHAGISLRLRRSSTGESVQTLKRTSETASLGQRDEWECPASSDTPDLDRFENLDLDPKIATLLADGLKPVFTIAVTRTAWQLRLESTTQVEAVLDEGEVQASNKSEPIHEIELELKSGPIAPMFRLALDLASKTALTFGAESKAERGYRLLLGQSRKPAHGRDPVLAGDASVQDGIRQTVAGALTHLVANMPAAAAGADEGVHQMRVALRRLRSALELFRPCIDRLTAERFSEVLRDLGAILGVARDWDVFVGETLPLAETAGIEIGALAAAATQRRRQAHRQVETMLAGPRLTELIVGLAGWSEDRPCLEDEIPLAGLAPNLLDKLLHKVARRGRRIETLAPETRHALRKSTKKLRYGIDALGTLYKRKHVDAYCDHLKELQDVLGTVNDAAMTPKLLRACVGDPEAASTQAATALLRRNKERHHKALRRLSDHWETFQDVKPFWH